MYAEDELKALGIDEDDLTEEELLFLLAALHTTLTDLENELRIFFQKYGKDGVITYAEVKKWVSSTNHTRRLTMLNYTVNELFETGFNAFERLFDNHLRTIVQREADFFGVKLDINDILNTPWGLDDCTWLQRLSAHRNRWINKINADLRVSFLKQDSVMDVLSQMADRGESMDTILSRLWRTESNAISSIARKDIFKQLGATHYRFIHVDGCTCELCNDMHYQVFPISEYVVGITANPLHPNCKDRTEPVFDYLE